MNRRPLPARRMPPRITLAQLQAEIRMVREMDQDAWAWVRELLPDAHQSTAEETTS